VTGRPPASRGRSKIRLLVFFALIALLYYLALNHLL
jgi:hypothetical protein